jgi:hypothetical protein
MTDINCYRQLRRDGGIRMGVDVDGEIKLSHFQQGRRTRSNPDPALEWYVDVRFKGSRLPVEPELVREWLLKHEPSVSAATEELAASLPAGLDPDDWPVQREFRSGSVRGAVVCSAVRRVSAQHISEMIRDLGVNWREYLAERLVPQSI